MNLMTKLRGAYVNGKIVTVFCPPLKYTGLVMRYDSNIVDIYITQPSPEIVTLSLSEVDRIE